MQRRQQGLVSSHLILRTLSDAKLEHVTPWSEGYLLAGDAPGPDLLGTLSYHFAIVAVACVSKSEGAYDKNEENF